MIEISEDLKDYSLRINRHKEQIDCQVAILKELELVDTMIKDLEDDPDKMKAAEVRVGACKIEGAETSLMNREVPNSIFRGIKQDFIEFLLRYRQKLINNLKAYEITKAP